MLKIPVHRLPGTVFINCLLKYCFVWLNKKNLNKAIQINKYNIIKWKL